MGLGKTLQSITLLYTLLRKGIYGRPTCRRILIVTPTSLVRNWDNELMKWLSGRVRAVSYFYYDDMFSIRGRGSRRETLTTRYRSRSRTATRRRR